MAYQLKSNPLENNPLFGNTPQEQPAPNPEKPADNPKSAKKSTRKPSGKKEKKTNPAPEPAPEKQSAPEDFVRATFIVRRDLLKLLKDYAYTERREIKEVINEILGEALAKIESDYAADGRKFISHE